LGPGIAFHASARREDDVKEAAPVKKGGLFGTGLSEWFALPLGLAAAVPALKYEWYVVNEETQLLAVFLAFCVTVYTQGGDAIYKSMDAIAQDILKEHQEAEGKVVAALEQKLEFLKANSNMVQDFEAINKIREETYANLNAAGKVKPYHDLKAQVERMIIMIAQEEANVAEKAKAQLMEEATQSVKSQFTESKELKKQALDSAIARIKGSASKDPVQATFIKFFKDKATAAAKADDSKEAQTQRAALIAKLNSVCKNEKFFFQFDESGKPKMIA
jgi:hypothetical protein